MVKLGFYGEEFSDGFFSAQKRWMEQLLKDTRVVEAYEKYAAQWGFKDVVFEDHFYPSLVHWNFSLLREEGEPQNQGVSWLFSSGRNYFDVDSSKWFGPPTPERYHLVKEIFLEMLSRLSEDQKEKLVQHISSPYMKSFWLWWDLPFSKSCTELSWWNREIPKVWKSLENVYPETDYRAWLLRLLREIPEPQRGSKGLEDLRLINLHFFLRFLFYLVEKRLVSRISYYPRVEKALEALRHGDTSLLDRLQFFVESLCSLIAIGLSSVPKGKINRADGHFSVEIDGKEFWFQPQTVITSTWMFSLI